MYGDYRTDIFTDAMWHYALAFTVLLSVCVELVVTCRLRGGVCRVRELFD